MDKKTVKKININDDLLLKEEAFLQLDPLERWRINNLLKERMFGGKHTDWKGQVVKKIKK